MTNPCKAIVKLTVCVLALAACFHAGGSAASEVNLCNEGNTPAYVAVVEVIDLGVANYHAWGWIKVANGAGCQPVYAAGYPAVSPVYIGLQYQDETGAWHVRLMQPEHPDKSAHHSDQRFCVTDSDAFDYFGKTLQDMATCKPGMKPMAFSLYVDLGEGCCNALTFHITPRYELEYASADPEFNPPVGPGKVEDLAPVLNGAADRASTLKSFLATHQPPITNLWLHWCMSDAAVQRQSWSDPQSARAQALGLAVRNFLDTHDFSAQADRAATVPIAWVRGNLVLTLRIHEANGAFEVLDAPGCGEGMQDVLTTHMQINRNTGTQAGAQAEAPHAGAILPTPPASLQPQPRASINEQMAAAVFNKNPFTVTKLLAAGADVNANMKVGMTPLHTAAILNAKDVAMVLLAHGAHVNAVDDEGRTPLHWAATGNARAVAELLLDHGASVNARDNKGRTPLRIALEQKASAVADLLRAHGGTE